MTAFFKSKKVTFICWCILFLIFFVFYVQIRPIVVSDIDDWTYVSCIRKAYPVWTAWNPAKVLPETWVGMIGMVGAQIVYPLCNDYTLAMTFCYATVVSAFIASFIVAVMKLIKKYMATTTLMNITIGTVFIGVHFLILKTKETGNSFMFSANDLNCYINYTVPLLFDVIFSIFWAKERYMNKKWTDYSLEKISLCVLYIYLAVFSNMVTNIALIAPMICWFCADFLQLLKHKRKISLKEFCEKYVPYIYMFALEIICLIFELHGGRAGSLAIIWKEAIPEMINDLRTLVKEINKPTLILMIITMSAGYILSSIKKKTDIYTVVYRKLMALFCYSGVISVVYIIALYTRIGLHKILRSENLMVMFLFWGIAFAISLAYLIRSYSKTIIIMPLVAYMFLCSVMYGGYPYILIRAGGMATQRQ